MLSMAPPLASLYHLHTPTSHIGNQSFTIASTKLTKSGVPSNRREKIPDGTLCVVCGDLASGIHYSVASCNGCKTFFRRALVNNQTFTCQFRGECDVGKSMRCVCRSCRLKKCFEMGMDPKAIQHDRDKIRYTKVLKRQKEEAQKAAEESVRSNELESPGMEVDSPVVVGTVECDLELDQCYVDNMEQCLKNLLDIEEKIVAIRKAGHVEVKTSVAGSMYTATKLHDDSWVRKYSTPLADMEKKDRHITIMEMRDWFDRDLTLMMEWVKALPEAQGLLLNDKAALLKAFACTYAVVQLAFYNEEDSSTKADHQPAFSNPLASLLESFMGANGMGMPLMLPPTLPALLINGEEPEAKRSRTDDTVSSRDDEDDDSDSFSTRRAPLARPVHHFRSTVTHRICYPDGLYLDRNIKNDENMPERLFENRMDVHILLMDAIWRMFMANNVDQEVFVMFKLMLLFSAETPTLTPTGRAIVDEQRAKAVDNLYSLVMRKNGRQGLAIFSNLCLMSSSIASISHPIRRIFSSDNYTRTDLCESMIVNGISA